MYNNSLRKSFIRLRRSTNHDAILYDAKARMSPEGWELALRTRSGSVSQTAPMILNLGFIAYIMI